MKSRLIVATLIAYAVGLHVAFLATLSDPIFEPDSVSYIEPAFNFIFSNRFLLSPERTPGYPLFLTVILALFRAFTPVLVLQHLLVLVTGLLAAVICARHFAYSWTKAAVVAFLVSSLPHVILRSHSIMTETLFTFFVLLSFWLYLRLLEKVNYRDAILCGLAMAMALLVRPAAWALVVVLGLAWLFHRNRRMIAPVAVTAMVVFAAVVLTFCSYNYRRNGFFGLDQFAGMSLIGPTAKFIEWDKLPDGPVRAALLPIIDNPARDQLLKEDDWVRSFPEGVVPRLAQKFGSPAAMNKLLMDLSLRGIFAHPFAFAFDQCRRWMDFMLERSRIPSIYLHPEFTVLMYRGMLVYDRVCEAFPVARKFTKYKASDFASYYDTLGKLNKLTDEEAVKLLAATTPKAYPYDRVLSLEAPLLIFYPLLKWIPLIALLASCSLLKGQTRFTALLLLVYWNVHILLTNVGGDRSYRHILPIEWIYWIFIVSGVSSLWSKRIRMLLP